MTVSNKTAIKTEHILTDERKRNIPKHRSMLRHPALHSPQQKFERAAKRKSPPISLKFARFRMFVKVRFELRKLFFGQRRFDEREDDALLLADMLLQ